MKDSELQNKLQNIIPKFKVGDLFEYNSNDAVLISLMDLSEKRKIEKNK